MSAHLLPGGGGPDALRPGPESSATPELERIVELAAALCEAPMAALALPAGEGWRLSPRRGLPATADAQVAAACARALRQREPVVLAQADADPQADGAAEAPRFLAALSLHDRDGAARGVLLVMDTRPRRLRGEKLAALEMLARQAAQELEAARSLRWLRAEHRRDQEAIGRLARLHAGRLDFLARHDPLTRLPNRQRLVERIDDLIATAGADAEALAVVQLDVQRLHQINDSFGRGFGDTLLRRLAARLRKALGARAVLGRMAGDHFGFVVAGASGSTELAHRIQAVLDRGLAAPFRIEGQSLRVAARAGVALHPQDGADAEALLRNAERALQQAKAESTPLAFYAPRMNAELAADLLLESRLRSALERRQFVLHYQPKVDAATGALTGVEGLIRWDDPDNGLVAPRRIIPLLEASGLIHEVGEWAIRRAVDDYRRWRELSPDPPRISVNVSPLQLHREDFVERVRRGLAGADGEDHGLDLEITESVLMTEVDANIDKLEQLRQLGVRVAIDDFGTGYSSLLYLAKLPLDSLKIDRSFVVRMPRRDSDRAIVSTIVGLAHQLGLSVVAEGVDAEEQARLLAGMDCDELQGFLFSEAMPAHAIGQLIRNGSLPGGPWPAGFSVN